MLLIHYIYIQKLISLLGYNNFIKKIYFFNKDLMIKVNLDYFLFFVKFLKLHENFRYNCLVDISCIDRLSHLNRFLIFYHFLSISFNHRITIFIESNEVLLVPSITFLFKSANWLEREVWDMFGVFFYNHPDLRRILTDYGFEGFPLRKDFPLIGYEEVRYDDEKKRVVYEPLEVSQEFRSFNFISPWEQIKNFEVKD